MFILATAPSAGTTLLRRISPSFCVSGRVADAGADGRAGGMQLCNGQVELADCVGRGSAAG